MILRLGIIHKTIPGVFFALNSAIEDTSRSANVWSYGVVVGAVGTPDPATISSCLQDPAHISVSSFFTLDHIHSPPQDERKLKNLEGSGGPLQREGPIE